MIRKRLVKIGPSRHRGTLIFFDVVRGYPRRVTAAQISRYQLSHIFKCLIYDLQRLGKIGPSRPLETLKFLDMVRVYSPRVTADQISCDQFVLIFNIAYKDLLKSIKIRLLKLLETLKFFTLNPFITPYQIRKTPYNNAATGHRVHRVLWTHLRESPSHLEQHLV